MEEQLISFETAKLAKEKGFGGKGLTTSNGYFRGNNLCNIPCNNKSDFCGKDEFSAPTQSLLQKWLREEHFLYVEPKRSHFDGYLGIAVFKCNVINGSYDDVKGKSYVIRTQEHMLDFNTYEEALEMGLLKALQFIGTGTIKNY